MIRLRPPFSAVALARWRQRFWAALVTGMAVFAGVVYLSIISSLRPASFAVPVAVYVCLSAAGAWGFLAFSLYAAYRSRRAWHLLSGCLFGSSCGVLLGCEARVSWHLPLPAAAAIGLVAALAAAAFSVTWSTRMAIQGLGWSGRYPADSRAAGEMGKAARRALGFRRTSAEEEKIARLNTARAAIARSCTDDAPDGLVTAADVLSSLWDDPPDNWVMAFGVAVDLVDAMSVRAAKHGDIGGYPRALGLLADAARRTPPDMGAMAIVHHRHACYQGAMADRLAPGPEADAHADAAIESLCAAIAAVTPAFRAELPDLHATLGMYLAGRRAHPADLDAGIELCRTAVRLAGHRHRARARAERTLAGLLTDRAWEAAGRLPADASPVEYAAVGQAVHTTLLEAEQLLRRALRHGGFDGRAEARELLAAARSARAVIMDGPGDDRRAAGAWQAAARAAAHADPLDRLRLGQEWVAWAESTQDVTWCAEAYAYLMSAVPPAVAVRYLAGERDRMLADLQSTAEEAGYWLAEAGRPGRAAIALELGRAVSLSEIIGRERPDLPAALSRAGRPDLLARYRAALSGYGTAAPPAPDDGLSSARQRAWSGYDTVVREIADELGIDVPGTEPTLAELAQAARDGPVVYLAVAARGGYAIVVPPTGIPVYRPLPGLSRAGVAEHAGSFLGQVGPTEIAARVAAVARWLWEGGIDALARDLPPGALVTIVPVGLLGLLPVHAAGGPTAAGQPPQDWAFLADLVTVRYAPNARTLLRARDRSGRLPRAALALLAVAVPDAAAQQSLCHAGREVAQVARRWARADTVTDGAPAAVERMMADHNVWHFACHCRVTPDSILDSALLLDGATLSLRAILALPPTPRRLAVLSACETHLSDARLPDEAMGLPAGLLQVGFAGVVASHWRVRDRATAFLMVRFHDLWHGQGLSPALALAEAQRSLRTALPTDLTACLEPAGDEPAPGRPSGQARGRALGPYRHPYFWAAFALTGQ